MKAKLLLEDGTLFEGESFGSNKTVYGEIVFNTGMTGYQEILTDPSYGGQVVVMTYPLIGNYGINTEDTESNNIKAEAFVVKELAEHESNWKSTQKLADYMKRNDIPGISGVDTRMLTKIIRTKGTMNCLITTENITDNLKIRLNKFVFPSDIVTKVSSREPITIGSGNKKIALVDLGVKTGIVRHLASLGCEVTVYPWNVSAQEILKSNPDAVFLSNGPGDPKDVKQAIETTKQLIGKRPLLGVCLGHQILCLALGGDTYKLKFGHRGSNHPVIDLDTNKVTITAQNHGYAVRENSLPEGCRVTHLNINDGTIEGFCNEELNIYSVQYHPEAGPGPRDANYLFKQWIELLN